MKPSFQLVANPETWKVGNEELIALIRSFRGQGMPTHKRLKIAESLIVYRTRDRRVSEPRIEPIAAKLPEIVNQERLATQNLTIDDLVGRINPEEPDAV